MRSIERILNFIDSITHLNKWENILNSQIGRSNRVKIPIPPFIIHRLNMITD